MVEINNELFGNARFYNGEAIYMKTPINSDLNTVSVVFEGNADLWDMQMAVAYLNKVKPETPKHLVIKYFPYSRMDREINDQLFSLELTAESINAMGLDKVFVLDPHSNVLWSNLKHMEFLDINHYVDQAIKDFKPDYIFFPDKGARDKYPSVIKACMDTDDTSKKVPYIYGNKVRDLENKGRIIKYEVMSDVNITGKRILIVDDICCKGGTFIWAASELKKLGASAVGLYVSHCENSIFEGDIFKTSDVDKVYTTRSLKLKLEILD